MSIQPRRIRLKPWLLAQVNSGLYPGLTWLSPDHRLFQIPWKHATRHTHTNAAEEEHTIFKAWAVETGKYQVCVDEPDPAKWKANLRCALNKSREFQLKYDGTKETPVKPYKIYEVLERTTADGGEEDEEEMPNLMDLSINPTGCDSAPFGSSFPVPVPEATAAANADVFNQLIVNQQPSLLLPVTSDPSAGFIAEALAANANAIEASSDHAVSMETGGNHGDAHTITQQQQQQQQQEQQCKYDLLSSVPLTDLDIRFLYRGKQTASLTVSNPAGCRLYSGQLEPTQDQEQLFGPVSLQQVLFPHTHCIQNHKQRFYTDALLDVMDRGLILEMCEQDIYAVRLCQCKVFWSGPESHTHTHSHTHTPETHTHTHSHSHTPGTHTHTPGTHTHTPGAPGPVTPNPMEREKKIRVFSLNHFLQGLILFQKGEAEAPPPFEISFCFGEDWPDRKPREKKLIIVQVVPVVARILTEMFSGELSWSTDSVRLQISNPDVKDRTVEQFKELQRLLQQGPWALNAP